MCSPVARAGTAFSPRSGHTLGPPHKPEFAGKPGSQAGRLREADGGGPWGKDANTREIYFLYPQMVAGYLSEATVLWKIIFLKEGGNRLFRLSRSNLFLPWWRRQSPGNKALSMASLAQKTSVSPTGGRIKHPLGERGLSSGTLLTKPPDPCSLCHSHGASGAPQMLCALSQSHRGLLRPFSSSPSE